MLTDAIVFRAPGSLEIAQLALTEPGPRDIVVDIQHTGISTGTEKLLWTGEMPSFPGMGYPLVPGYESTGEVVEAGAESGFNVGTQVFVPGASCWSEARGLFGGAAARLVSDGARAIRIDAAHGPEGALLALAATAHHALAGHGLPDLIVGHGVLGRLLARLTVALGGAPTVWEADPARRGGAEGYALSDADSDTRRDYATVYDASGNAALIDPLVGRLARGGELVLCGFYRDRLSFAFPPAFMTEARFRIAAEWQPADLVATRDLIEAGRLSLGGLITHRSAAADADAAYRTAFDDTACLKMILDWKENA